MTLHSTTTDRDACRGRPAPVVRTRARHPRPAPPNGSPAGTRPSDPRGEGDDPLGPLCWRPSRGSDFSVYGLGVL